MEEKKSNFGKGVLSGIAVTLAVMVIFVSLAVGRGYVLSPKSNESDRYSANSNSIEVEETVVSQEVLDKMQDIQDLIDNYYLYETNEEDLADGIYAGMLDSLGDPYSVYYTAEEYADLMESSNGTYSGIGVSVQQNASTGVITAVKPFEGCPGAEAGIKAGDIIYAIDGTEVTGMDLSSAVALIKGEEGTSVGITIYRDGEMIDLEVERRTIEIPTIESEMLENNIGYIAVTEFDSVTSNQYKEAIESLMSQGMEGLIVDLRDNPGGLLSTVCTMLDEMLPEGLIVYTEDKYGNREEEKSSGDNQFELPLVVLVNGNSASASEIYAGAIKDYGIGTIIGTQTFGKGIVQRVMSLNDGTAVKVTVSNYFTPNGNNIHGIGIEPDIIVEQNTDTEDDEQLLKAIEVLTEDIGK